MYKMGLTEQKAELEIMQQEYNLKKLEVRVLELDEEKIKIGESILAQKARLDELRGNK